MKYKKPTALATALFAVGVAAALAYAALTLSRMSEINLDGENWWK